MLGQSARLIGLSCLLALVLSGARPAARQAADVQVTATLLRTFAATGRMDDATFRDAGGFLRALGTATDEWIRTGAPEDSTRRRQVAALLVLRAVEQSGGRRGPDDLRLIEWGCDLLRRGSASEFERIWMLASYAVMQRAPLESSDRLPSGTPGHLQHARRRFPTDSHLRLMELLQRPEAGALTNRPGARRDWLVRYWFDRNPTAGPDPVMLDVTQRDLEKLRADPLVGAEARIHLGLIRFHLNDLESAVAETTSAARETTDPYLHNFGWLVAGLGFEWMDRAADAASAYQQASLAEPRAKASATLHAMRQFLSGDRAGADRTIESAHLAPDRILDPWQYPAGHTRFLPQWMLDLHRLAAVPLAVNPVSEASGVTTQSNIQMQLPPATAANQPKQLQPVSARPAFRQETSMVAVDVDVRTNRVPVSGLTASDFMVLDNGVTQKISDLSLEPVPLDLSLILDFDQFGLSRRGRWVFDPESAARQIRDDVQALAHRLRPIDRLRVIKVGSENGEIVRLQPQPSIPMAKFDRQPFLRSYNRTAALYDALTSVLVRRTPPARRHVIVLFTEGVDDASVVRPRELDAIADVADAVLYTLRRPTATERWLAEGVRRMDTYARSLWPPDPTVVEEAARRTGGRAIPSLGSSISEQLNAILDGFRQSYVLTYEPDGVARDGWHTLEVRLKREGRYELTARRGYFAGGSGKVPGF